MKKIRHPGRHVKAQNRSRWRPLRDLQEHGCVLEYVSGEAVQK